jgi:predicted dehydrogenase
MTVANKPRAAVIGCGAISASHLRFLSTSTDVDLAAVCDVSPSVGRYAVEAFGAPESFTDASEMLSKVAPDVVHVLTPPASHRPLIELALNAGAHVYCEKPITFTVADLEDVQTLARERTLRCIEGHNYRFNNQVRKLDSLIASGALGEIHWVGLDLAVPLAQSDLGAPGGALHDYITHATYLALHFLGDRGFDDVRARWALVGDHSRARYDDLTAFVGAGKACASIRISGRPRPFCFRINLRGTAGAAETDLFQPYLRVDGEDPDAPLRALTDQAANGARLLAGTARNFCEKVLQHSPLHGLERLLGLFYQSVVTGGPSPVTDEQVMTTSRLIETIIAEASS